MTILSFILWILMGVATGYLAGQRGRDPVIWFMIGILLGVFGLLLLFIMPPVGEDAKESKEDDLTLPELPVTAHPHDSYLIKDWFYLDGSHQQQGPVSYSELKKLWGESKITEQSFVWAEGMDEWQRIHQQVELDEALKKEE